VLHILRVFVALGMQRAMCMPHSVICDRSGSTAFISHYLMKSRILEKKVIENKRCFDFLYTFVWSISHCRKNL